MTEWNKELEKRILKKSRFTLTIRILRLLFWGFLVYFIYILLLNFTVDRLHIAEENDFYTKLALDWRVPNVRGTFDFTEEEITVFGTKRLSYPLVKKVGKSDIVIGTADVTKRISNSNSNINYKHPGKEHLNEFSFYYPEDPSSGKKLTANAEPNVWETLDMLHEGTVAELAFSMDRFMAPEELIRLLEPYDLSIVWMPLHTGEFVDFTPGSAGGSGTEVSVFDGIGLVGTRSVSGDFLSATLAYQLDGTSIDESQKAMLDNMETLLSEKPSAYHEFFLGLSHLNERYDYLMDNGFTVYGAVVTGPVKELLKLADEERIQGEQLGEVELWNWENP
ncbi:anti-sigma factor [Planococcus maritimus]|uniref:anti-sigma factor n=1 Tax=Planococcus maritimus TaxID=192421 RepID=UPI00313860DC